MPGLVLQPALDGGHVGQQVGARPISSSAPSRPARTGRDQRPGALLRQRQHPLPDLRPVEVDRGDPGAPAHQRGQRTHLGAGSEHGDGVALQPQPVGVVEDLADGLAHARLDDAGLGPRIQSPPDAAGTQPLAVVRQHQLVDGLAVAHDLDALQRSVGRACRNPVRPLVERVLLAVLAEHLHLFMQGVESTLGHVDGRVGGARAPPRPAAGSGPGSPCAMPSPVRRLALRPGRSSAARLRPRRDPRLTYSACRRCPPGRPDLAVHR